MHKLCTIIVNWNSLLETEHILSELPKEVGGMPHLVVVVDNASRNNEVTTLARKFPWCRHVALTKNEGFTGGNNVVLTNTNTYPAEYYLLLNPDTSVTPTALEELIAYLDSNPKAGIIGPRILNWDTTHQSSGAGLSLWTGNTPLLSSRETSTPYEVPMVSGCALMVRNQVLQRVGGLWQDYIAYYEETELCLRTKQAGYDVMLVPTTTVRHKGGAGGTTSAVSEYFLARNRILFLRRNGTSLQQFIAIPYSLLIYASIRGVRCLLHGRNGNITKLWSGLSSGLHQAITS
jgi:hypothetical protein